VGSFSVFLLHFLRFFFPSLYSSFCSFLITVVEDQIRLDGGGVEVDFSSSPSYGV